MSTSMQVTQGVITVGDSIAGSANANNNLFINSSDATAKTSIITPANSLTDGRVNLNGDITNATVTVAGTGDTYFGQSNSVATNYYNGSVINLNSSATQYFYNGVTGATINANAGTQNFNSAIANSTITATGGTQYLNNTITGSTINVQGSTMNLASTGSIGTTALNLTSGTLDIRNGNTDTLNVTNFTANSAATPSNSTLTCSTELTIRS